MNLYLHGDPSYKETFSMVSRLEIEELMPWCPPSHPMHQLMQTLMEIDMDEIIFMLLATITLFNYKEIHIMRVQDHLKLKLFRYLKSKLSQSEAILWFRKIEETLSKLLCAKDYHSLFQ